MKALTRYDPWLDHPSCGYECCGGGKAIMEADADGRYYLAAEVDAVLVEERNESATLRASMQTYRNQTVIDNGKLRAEIADLRAQLVAVAACSDVQAQHDPTVTRERL